VLHSASWTSRSGSHAEHSEQTSPLALKKKGYEQFSHTLSRVASVDTVTVPLPSAAQSVMFVHSTKRWSPSETNVPGGHAAHTRSSVAFPVVVT
jgi:hypothetical protein